MFVCDAMWALMLPVPASDCEMRWNASVLPQMSPPPPWTVQVFPLVDWLPAGVGLPMSEQVHAVGHGGGGGGGGSVGLAETASMVTVLRQQLLCAVTAIPASSVVPMLIVVLEPGISDQVVPSAEV